MCVHRYIYLYAYSFAAGRRRPWAAVFAGAYSTTQSAGRCPRRSPRSPTSYTCTPPPSAECSGHRALRANGTRALRQRRGLSAAADLVAMGADGMIEVVFKMMWRLSGL